MKPDNTIHSNAKKLTLFLQKKGVRASLPYKSPQNYHMGSLLIDVILQPGVSYKSVVAPRVDRLQHFYPEANSISGLRNLVRCIGSKGVLLWKHPEKPRRLVDLLDFLISENLDTRFDLVNWLSHAPNQRQLLEVRGMGMKSLDYLKILLGMEAVAIDRHIRNLFREAGLKLHSYSEHQATASRCAAMMGITLASLDFQMWLVSTSGGGVPVSTPA